MNDYLTKTVSAEDADLAVDFLAAGEVVGLPTETVYGLAADATRAEAVLKIFEAKERPFFDPLIVHLPDREWLDRLTRDRAPLVEALINRFWPGPLTLVLPRQEIVPDLVTSGLSTVAVRMSAHPVFQSVITRFGKPLAAPSANRFGRISPTSARDVQSELAGRIPLIVDGGATRHGLESTIVSVSEAAIRILRSGPITPEELGEFGEVSFGSAGATPDAPGQLKSHYAPRTPLTLVTAPGVPAAMTPSNSFGYLAWQNPPPGVPLDQVRVLSGSGDLREAAATLFSKMRDLDGLGLAVILAEPVPEHGLGIAIMDRLRKASARD